MQLVSPFSSADLFWQLKFRVSKKSLEQSIYKTSLIQDLDATLIVPQAYKKQ